MGELSESEINSFGTPPLFAHLSQLTPRSILPVPDIAQARKKEGRKRTSKEHFSSLVGRTVEAYLADAVVAMPVAGRIRIGHIHENAKAYTFHWHKASRSLTTRKSTC